jgi:cobalt-zinc-cadmium efflux system membrane fusion protein
MPVQGVVEVPPQNLVSISAPLGGYLRSSDLLPGMEIQKGQTLAIMEDPRFIQLQQDYLVAEGKVTMLTQDFERQKALNASKTTSDKVFQEATAELNTQKVTLRSLGGTTAVDRCGSKHADRRDHLAQRGASFTDPWLGIEGEREHRSLRATHRCTVRTGGSQGHPPGTDRLRERPAECTCRPGSARAPNRHPQDEYEAEVILVGRSLDADRSAIVHCHFTKAPNDLVPGMAMSASLESRTDTVWCVPEEAVVRSGNGQAVFIANVDGSYTMVPLTTGANEYGYIELVEPSTELRERPLVLKGAYSLLSSLKNSGEE